MELKFSSDLDSAKRLDEIMNSYSGRDRGSILADEHSLAVTLVLLEHGRITVTEHTYPYDQDIRGDSEMMEVYSELGGKPAGSGSPAQRSSGYASTPSVRCGKRENRSTMESLCAGGRARSLPTAATSTCLNCCSTSQVMNKRSSSIFLPIRTGRRITLQNTTASTCQKPPSRVQESTVNPSGRNCVRHPRSAMSSLRFRNWRMIQCPRHKNTKTDQSQSAVSVALWL